MFIYGRYRTEARALDALDDCFAMGEVCEAELYGNGVKKIGKFWCIVLKG